MRPHIPTPRLLPITIMALGGLLAMKTVTLVRAAVPANVMVPHVLAAVDQPVMLASAEKKPAATGGHGASTSPPPEAAPVAPVPAAPPPVTDSEKAVLLELRQRRQELDSRELAVSARESMLTAAEQKLSNRVDELQTLQHQLETLEANRRQREDAAWQGLVKVYENMKPRDAANIFNDLTMPTLLQIVDRMNDRKAAQVMAAMNADKARDVTAQLAQMRLRREISADASARGTASGTTSNAPVTSARGNPSGG